VSGRSRRETRRAKRDKRRDEDARGKCTRERGGRGGGGREGNTSVEERASGWIGVADGVAFCTIKRDARGIGRNGRIRGSGGG
jgi:hypothetical protein